MASARRLLSTKRAITGLLSVTALGLMASPALASNKHLRASKAHSHALNAQSVPFKIIMRAANVHRIHAAIDDVSQCVTPLLTQAFLSWGDNNYFALVDGESPDSFDGTGWTLNDGANIVSTTLQDGTTGNVLDLPPNSSATSPVFCINVTYPMARVMVRDLSGPRNVQFYSSRGNHNGHNTGVDGAPPPPPPGTAPSAPTDWSLSKPLKIDTGASQDWELASFTFLAGKAKNSEVQLYNFYVDPYAKR